MIKYSCPKCHAQLESPSSLGGKYDECPLCRSKNVVLSPRKSKRKLWWVCGGLAGVVLLACAGVLLWQAKKPSPTPNEFQDCLDAAFLSYSQNNDFKSAIAYYDKALALQPGYGDAYHNRGCLYIHVGDVDRGIADLDKAIQIAPNDAMAYANRGIAYRKKGDAQKAEADFQKAVSLDATVGTSSIALHVSDVSREMKFKVVDGKFVKD
jgi:tetratricopeptide (TPR) repeat protein